MYLLLVFGMAWAQSIPQPTTDGKPCANGGHYKVSLTFDDGPSVPQTQIILDELKKRSLKATFFVSSSHFENLLKSQPPSSSEKTLLALVRREQAEGHVVGSHSYEHMEHAGNTPSSPSPETVEENLRRNDVVLDKMGLKKTGMPFRFPYGSGWFRGEDQERADVVMREIKDRGFVPTHWDIDSWDWSRIKRKALPDSLLNEICSHGGGIILMHDIQKFTSENLGTLIDWIQASGHQIVPLSEIRNYKSPVVGPLTSLADSANWLKTCGRPIGDLDTVWPDCSTYHKFSTDIPGNKERGTR